MGGSAPNIVPSPAADRLDDATLVARVRDGDRWACEALFRRHLPVVHRVVTRMLQDRTEAEDVCQDAFVTAFEKIDTLEQPAAFKGWLLRIAVRRVQRRYRKLAVLRAVGLHQTEDPVTLEALAQDGCEAETRAELAMLDRTLARVPAKARMAWLLRHVEGLTLEEVGEACGCSLATAKRRIRAAHDVVQAHVKMEANDG